MEGHFSTVTPRHQPEPDATLRDAFAFSLKPRLARLLTAFGLDVSYHRAEGDRLYYRRDGLEIEVLDFIGGFGASLLGHNHPEVLEVARQLFEQKRPFNAQASIRGYAGLLAKRLSETVERSTHRSYVATLASTGAEAVEAAIKHAELEMMRRNQRLLQDMRENGRKLRIRMREGRASISENLFEEASRRLGGVPIKTIDELLDALGKNLEQTLEQEPSFLAVAGSFHGKSTGALKLTYRLEFRNLWRRIGLLTTFLSPDDISAVQAKIQQARLHFPVLGLGSHGEVELRDESIVNISACFLEPIQGEGGIHELGREYVGALRQVTQECGFPLVIDEIQCGMGRCGTFLASEHFGIRGDYYLLSKSLGGGLAKVSALLVDRARYDPEFGYLHTSTFADDDFSSAIALKALEILERDRCHLIRECKRKGEDFLFHLRELQVRFPNQVCDVRGRGLMVGLELQPQMNSPSPLLRVLSEQNLLGYLASGYLLREHGIRVAPTLSGSSVIRLEPSCYVSEDSMHHLVSAFEDFFGLLQRNEIGQLFAYLADRPTRSPDPGCLEKHEPSTFAHSIRATEGVTKVAFLAHFPEPGDLQVWEPRLRAFSQEDCARVLDRTRGLLRPFVLDLAELRSSRGQRVHVTFIGVPFTAEQAVQSLREGTDWPHEMVKEAVELAYTSGCRVVGFGGHTSIVTDNCRSIIDDRMTLTSGNSLTVAAAYEASCLSAKRLGLDLQTCRLGVVGAAGNVGAVLAEIAADDLGEILLIGRKGSERFLNSVAHKVYRRAFNRIKRNEFSGIAARIACTETIRRALDGQIAHFKDIGVHLHSGLERELADRAPVRLATSLETLRDCHLIISATNAPKPIILPSHIGDGPILVCDVAVPRDVDQSVQAERPRAIVIRGGILRAPLGQIMQIPAMGLYGSELYGCLAETILLGFAGPECPSSYGKLSSFHLSRIRHLAELHGFEIDPALPGRSPSSNEARKGPPVDHHESNAGLGSPSVQK